MQCIHGTYADVASMPQSTKLTPVQITSQHSMEADVIVKESCGNFVMNNTNDTHPSEMSFPQLTQTTQWQVNADTHGIACDVRLARTALSNLDSAELMVDGPLSLLPLIGPVVLGVRTESSSGKLRLVEDVVVPRAGNFSKAQR